MTTDMTLEEIFGVASGERCEHGAIHYVDTCVPCMEITIARLTCERDDARKTVKLLTAQINKGKKGAK